jgi:hypothetical protein
MERVANRNRIRYNNINENHYQCIDRGSYHDCTGDPEHVLSWAGGFCQNTLQRPGVYNHGTELKEAIGLSVAWIEQSIDVKNL